MDIREKLVELLEENCRFEQEQECVRDCQYCMADHLIANGVTVQKRGRWLYSSIKNARFRVCDQCTCAVEKLECQSEYNYCPNCGAKMEG